MRNFKSLIWTDETKPETMEPVLVCISVNGYMCYRVMYWDGNEWRYPASGLELETDVVKAWAYIPRCAFVYPERRGL